MIIEALNRVQTNFKNPTEVGGNALMRTLSSGAFLKCGHYLT
jgi:hypothetical protein